MHQNCDRIECREMDSPEGQKRPYLKQPNCYPTE